MATRNPRIGPPGLTKTQALRQARSSTLVKEYERKQEAERQPQPQRPQPIEAGRRRRYIPSEPKRVEFTRPTMTKATLARVKHAERVKQEYERKQEEMMPTRRAPRRTPAPVSGDPRFGRERIPPAGRAPSVSAPRAARRPAPERRPAEPAIPERTRELAKSMNAQVVQAEPIGEGPIDSIVIPPRTVSENRTTIVSIPQPPAAVAETLTSEVANRSIQVISETLDEQDAAEATAVQGKLEDLQQARRNFVMAVANVGGNAVQLAEEERYIYPVPDIESELFRVEYGREHPSVVAAREFAQRSMAGIRAREEARRTEREFERVAREPLPESLRFDVPFEEEFLREGDVSWEEEEDIPVPSRTRAAMRDVPRREVPYEYAAFDPEELERFFDVERYPPSPLRGPPPGREHLPPDLWELEDPWATCGICPRRDVSDLIRFESP